HFDRDVSDIAHFHDVALGRHFDVQRVLAAADFDFGHAELVSGLGEIDERGRTRVAFDRDLVDQAEPVAVAINTALVPRVPALCASYLRIARCGLELSARTTIHRRLAPTRSKSRAFRCPGRLSSGRAG